VRVGDADVRGPGLAQRLYGQAVAQELVVGGFTEPRGTRKGLGALLVGYYEQGELLGALIELNGKKVKSFVLTSG